ncbi:hypothetical protein E4T52_04253 [Aureobasidium sp. EXF-3400]|nr:hypothetical protein E4T51_10331 [Aureobasidium sp. EXF-12344]KAI4780817.1 hypothetical protein E4T52_04253 [Aureobasidium sp. EXF-3400]
MALVGYSDSEGSDSESPNVAPVHATTKPSAKQANFQKLVNPSAPRKIKVDLPTVQPEAEAVAPPAKKPRTAGKFGGFNSFLPAPKRAADAKKGLGSGVNLKTGAEPAFSRERVEPDPSAFVPKTTNDEPKDNADTSLPAPFQDESPPEVKPVGNAMKFKPLSVTRKKAPKKKILPNATPVGPPPVAQPVTQTPQPPAPKPKISLFSVTHDDNTAPASAPEADYQPLLAEPEAAPVETFDSTMAAPAPVPADPNSLTAIADDLGLSAGERRRLFGRNKDAASIANVTYLNMEEEYNNNEQARIQGQAVEHRAVKAVAPGKHSLQQLVNSASTQKEALEDAWAQGRRNKAEAGSHYGF